MCLYALFLLCTIKEDDSMKKSIKIFLIIMAVLIVSNVIICCVFSFDSDDYEYYRYNIVWKEAQREIQGEFLSGDTYYKIKGVKTKEFVGCRYSETFWFPWYEPVIMKHKDFEGDLTVDSTSARLILGSRPAKDFSLYEEEMEAQLVAQLDATSVQDIVDKLNSETPDYYLDEKDFHDWAYLEATDGYSHLKIVFSITDYDNLMWIGSVIKHDDRYFIRMINESDRKTNVYLPCGEELSKVIDSVVEEYDLEAIVFGSYG